MGIIFVILLLALSFWSIFATFRRVRHTHVGRSWRIAFAVLTVIGLVVGSWMAFNFEYQISSRMRYVSFPMPLGFFHLEDGQWVDFVTPPYVMYPGLVANVIAIVAIKLLPLLIASVVFSNKTPNPTKP